MTHLPRGLAAFAALGLLAGCTSILSVAEPPRETAVFGFDQGKALASVNAFRARNGLAPLRSEPRLAAAAEAQSRAMAARADMDHYVDGPLPARIKRFGYPFATAAENIAMGQQSFDQAMAGWERSAGHRRNLLDPKMTEAGFAAARDATTGRVYWTQIFGRPRPADTPAMGAGPLVTLAGVPLPSR